PFPTRRSSDLGALRAAQLVLRLGGRNALGVLSGDLGDDVAAAHALLVGGRALEDAERRDVAVDRHDRDAETVVAAFLPLAHLRVLARIEEARMRIEGAEHAADRAG